jgi:hypothetical protein
LQNAMAQSEGAVIGSKRRARATVDHGVQTRF